VKHLLCVLTATAALCAAGCGEEAPAPLKVTRIASPAEMGSGQPQLSSSSNGAIMSWIVQGDTGSILMFSERTSGTWSEPIKITEGPTVVTNWADVPSVVRVSDSMLAAHWLDASGESDEAYDVKVAFSKDNGRDWAPAISAHRDATMTPHGFASLFPLNGGFGLIWLDGRDQKLGDSGEFVGDMAVRFAPFDANGLEGPEVVVNKRTCECCQTGASLTANGPIVAFRNRSAEEIRDIYTSRMVDGQWTAPAAVHNDGWMISGCPINGPAVSARGASVAVAWFTVLEGNGHAFVAFSNDAGQTFGTPVRVDDDKSLGRVDVELLADDRAAVTWAEFSDQKAALKVRQVTAGGQRSEAAPVTDLDSDRTSGFPHMALAGNELLFAWADNGEAYKVQAATAPLP
jgi:hypothetical protein